MSRDVCDVFASMTAETIPLCCSSHIVAIKFGGKDQRSSNTCLISSTVVSRAMNITDIQDHKLNISPLLYVLHQTTCGDLFSSLIEYHGAGIHSRLSRIHLCLGNSFLVQGEVANRTIARAKVSCMLPKHRRAQACCV